VIGAKADTPEAANHLLKTLRIMLGYAVAQGMLANYLAAGIKKYRSQGEGHHSWSASEITRFEERHPIGSKARLALALGLYTAQRKGDVLRMGWQHVSGDTIAVRQEKTNAALLIPIHPQLAAALASVPRDNLTFLMTEHGAPFTPMGFGNWWHARCNEAGLPHLVPWPAQGGSDAVGERGLHGRSGQSHHRSPLAHRGGPLYPRGRSVPACAAGDREAEKRDGRRTKIVQPSYPVGQNRKQLAEMKRQKFEVEALVGLQRWRCRPTLRFGTLRAVKCCVRDPWAPELRLGEDALCRGSTRKRARVQPYQL
jgi:hypothetical protein